MKRKTVSGITFPLLLVGMLTLAFNVGAVDDLELEMTVSNTTITIGEWIDITLTLRNIGTSNITIEFSPPLFDVYYCTPHGCFNYIDDKAFPLVVVSITLEPGQNYTETLEWNLYQHVNGAYYPPQSGIYYLWGICYWENITTSSPIAVTLIEQVYICDIDGDGVVFTKDLGLFARAWASEAGDPNWDERCDFDGDGKVFTVDLGIFTEHWTYGL